MQSFWLRFGPYLLVRPAQNEQTVSVLVNIQPRHYIRLGVAAQSLLVGYGQTDSHLTLADIDESKWTFDEAVSYCRKDLVSFKKFRGASFDACRRDTVLNVLEASPNVRLGQPCIAPNGVLSQELVMDTDDLEKLIEQAKSETWPFLIVKTICDQCIETGNLDVQPRALIGFLGSLLRGTIRAPGKLPKQLAFQTRNGLIRALVRSLTLHGLPATRNDTSAPLSGCDAVARAAVLAEIPSPRSYETVKKLYFARAD